MKNILVTIELISGLLLIGAILIHTPKGEGLGAIGGQAKMFNNPHKGMEAGLDRFTYIVATIFLGVATVLGIFF